MKTSLLSFVLSLAVSTVLAAEDNAAARKQCQKNLQKIYDAIQSYRLEHKQLPPYLHSLTPAHITGELVFQCPTAEGKEHPFAHLKDPKLDSTYIYEFSAAEAGHVWGGGKTTMAEMKMLQMAVVGGAVPILRCHFHDPILNMSFDGDIYESPLEWESLHREKIAYQDMAPTRIRAKMLRSLGDAAGDQIAFELLQDAANLTSGDNAEQAMRAAAKAAEFLEKHPTSEKVKEAKQIQSFMLYNAAHSGNAQAKERLTELAQKSKSDPLANREDAFNLNAMALNLSGVDPRRKEYENGIRGLMRDFPERPEPYQMLLSVAEQRDDQEAKKIIEEVIASGKAPEEAKRMAKGHLRKMNLRGTPLEIAFTALDGRKVDLAKMQGKVVLVDFWATWCGPCIAELPKVKAVYDKFHDKGFEIVGISFDNDKSALEKFIKQQKLAWPQYFDGKGWQNQFGQDYAISSIPAMWLVGKDGKVADLQARQNLAEKVEKLLNDGGRIGR